MLYALEIPYPFIDPVLLDLPGPLAVRWYGLGYLVGFAFAYYALGDKRPPYDYLTPMIRRLLDAYGPDRLMWASDAPYQMTNGNTYQASIDFVKQGLDFLSEADRRKLLRTTAERVFYGPLG